MTAKTRSGYTVTYTGCPIMLASKLQTEVALLTTEAEYISLSHSPCDTIPLMRLFDEVSETIDSRVISAPKVRCTVFEDNLGALELANVPKMRPCTKHINIMYHHFREHVCLGLVTVESVKTDTQVADIFTISLPLVTFKRNRLQLQLW